jgi:hypothetical protein
MHEGVVWRVEHHGIIKLVEKYSKKKLTCSPSSPESTIYTYHIEFYKVSQIHGQEEAEHRYDGTHNRDG